MTVKTNAQKQADLRARRLAQGITELRGLYAPTTQHAAIKAEVRKKLKATP
jgi:hypothetical protein